jgi:hypothetical protein
LNARCAATRPSRKCPARRASTWAPPHPCRHQASVNPELQAEIRQFQAAYLQFARRVVAETEDVGERFAEEARKIHYGESEERGIRGKASREETEALLDEGITVMPLPVPEGFNGPLQ